MKPISKKKSQDIWDKFIKLDVELVETAMKTIIKEQVLVLGYMKAAGEDGFKTIDDQTFLTFMTSLVYWIFRDSFGPLPPVQPNDLGAVDINMRLFSDYVNAESEKGVAFAMDNLLNNFNQAGILEASFLTLQKMAEVKKLGGKPFESMPKMIHYLMVLIKVFDGEIPKNQELPDFSQIDFGDYPITDSDSAKDSESPD